MIVDFPLLSNPHVIRSIFFFDWRSPIAKEVGGQGPQTTVEEGRKLEKKHKK